MILFIIDLNILRKTVSVAIDKNNFMFSRQNNEGKYSTSFYYSLNAFL